MVFTFSDGEPNSAKLQLPEPLPSVAVAAVPVPTSSTPKPDPLPRLLSASAQCRALYLRLLPSAAASSTAGATAGPRRPRAAPGLCCVPPSARRRAAHYVSSRALAIQSVLVFGVLCLPGNMVTLIISRGLGAAPVNKPLDVTPAAVEQQGGNRTSKK